MELARNRSSFLVRLTVPSWHLPLWCHTWSISFSPSLSEFRLLLASSYKPPGWKPCNSRMSICNKTCLPQCTMHGAEPLTRKWVSHMLMLEYNLHQNITQKIMELVNWHSINGIFKTVHTTNLLESGDNDYLGVYNKLGRDNSWRVLLYGKPGKLQISIFEAKRDYDGLTEKCWKHLNDSIVKAPIRNFHYYIKLLTFDSFLPKAQSLDLIKKNIAK